MGIVIRKNPNGDTRTAPKDVTFEQFQEANDMHIRDVRLVLEELGEEIKSIGEMHDCTKKTQERMFYRDFLSTMNEGTNFVEGEWYNLHVNAERHHLFSKCPSDVDLLDVLEMIADCVCAGMARSGEIRDLEIDSNILKKAVKNTVEHIKGMITVK